MEENEKPKTGLEGVKERLLFFLSCIDVRPATFERKMGLSGGYLRNATGNFGIDKLMRMGEAYPDLNIYWVLTGEGHMFKSEPQTRTIELQYGDRIIGHHINNRIHEESADVVRAYEGLISKQDDERDKLLEEVGKLQARIRELEEMNNVLRESNSILKSQLGIS